MKHFSELTNHQPPRCVSNSNAQTQLDFAAFIVVEKLSGDGQRDSCQAGILRQKNCNENGLFTNGDEWSAIRSPYKVKTYFYKAHHSLKFSPSALGFQWNHSTRIILEFSWILHLNLQIKDPLQTITDGERSFAFREKRRDHLFSALELKRTFFSFKLLKDIQTSHPICELWNSYFSNWKICVSNTLENLSKLVLPSRAMTWRGNVWRSRALFRWC